VAARLRSGAVLMIDLQALELPLPVSDAASNIAVMAESL
jgi:hypothetical protein